jgi:hypothetical protein
MIRKINCNCRRKTKFSNIKFFELKKKISFEISKNCPEIPRYFCKNKIKVTRKENTMNI